MINTIEKDSKMGCGECECENCECDPCECEKKDD